MTEAESRWWRIKHAADAAASAQDEQDDTAQDTSPCAAMTRSLFEQIDPPKEENNQPVEMHLTKTQKRVLQALGQEVTPQWINRASLSTTAKTLNMLERHDLIASRKYHDGTVEYKITVRGQRALAASTPKYRNDGLCPRCGVRPRLREASGKLRGYCRECGNVVSSERNRAVSKARLCVRCNTNPRRYNSQYCDSCVQQTRRANRRRSHQSRLQRHKNGEIFICAVEGCNERCAVHPLSVSSYCPAHQRAYQARQRRQRFVKRFTQKVRKNER